MPIKNEAAKVHLLTCCADALQRSIAAKRGGKWFCVASNAMGEPAVELEGRETLAMQMHLRGTLHGHLRIEIAQNDANSLFESDASSPLLDSWQKVMQGMVQRLPKRAVDAGMCVFSVESYDFAELSANSVQIGEMELGQADRTRCVLRVMADNELTESFRAAEWKVSSAAAKDDVEQNLTPELERIIDVPLSVTLRFGQRNMRLREVLELNAGALVELDRQVEDPVDLILDERVIARGEVVIVDGNYGLRVTEIVERPSTVTL